MNSENTSGEFVSGSASSLVVLRARNVARRLSSVCESFEDSDVSPAVALRNHGCPMSCLALQRAAGSRLKQHRRNCSSSCVSHNIIDRWVMGSVGDYRMEELGREGRSTVEIPAGNGGWASSMIRNMAFMGPSSAYGYLPSINSSTVQPKLQMSADSVTSSPSKISGATIETPTSISTYEPRRWPSCSLPGTYSNRVCRRRSET